MSIASRPLSEFGSASVISTSTNWLINVSGPSKFTQRMFSVRPERQGTGVGKRLMAEAERVAREEWALPAMRMTVIDLREELIAFYERRGYRRTGVKKPFPYGDPRYGLPKRDDLRFEILEKPL